MSVRIKKRLFPNQRGFSGFRVQHSLKDTNPGINVRSASIREQDGTRVFNRTLTSLRDSGAKGSSLFRCLFLSLLFSLSRLPLKLLVYVPDPRLPDTEPNCP